MRTPAAASFFRLRACTSNSRGLDSVVAAARFKTSICADGSVSLSHTRSLPDGGVSGRFGITNTWGRALNNPMISSSTSRSRMP